MSAAFAVVLVVHLLSQLVAGRPLFEGQALGDEVWTGFLVGARASLLEEGVDLVFLIGAPIAVAVSYGFASWSRGAQVACVAGLVVVSSALRGMQHIYQEDYRLYVTFLLGVGWALVFLWSRSVWPVVIAHWAFDWLYSCLSMTVVVPLLIVIIVTGIVPLYAVLRPRNPHYATRVVKRP